MANIFCRIFPSLNTSCGRLFVSNLGESKKKNTDEYFETKTTSAINRFFFYSYISDCLLVVCKTNFSDDTFTKNIYTKKCF